MRLRRACKSCTNHVLHYQVAGVTTHRYYPSSTWTADWIPFIRPSNAALVSVCPPTPMRGSAKLSSFSESDICPSRVVTAVENPTSLASCASRGPHAAELPYG